MLKVDILGLRDLNARFASMRDKGMVAIQMEEAEAAAQTVEDIYRRHAPRSQKVSKDEPGHFYETIQGHASSNGAGFEVAVDTSNPQLRRWLAEGTGVYAGHGRIYPQRGRALGPITGWAAGGSGPLFFASIAGMKAQPWEARARDEAEPLVRSVGSRIGQRVVVSLAGL